MYLIAALTLVSLSIILDGSKISLFLTLCGITATVLNSGGLRICFPFYFLQAALYGILALKNRFYGEVLINLAYAVPMYIHAILFWKKKALNQEIADIATLSVKQIFVICILGAVFIPVYGYVLFRVGTVLPYLNSLATFVYITIVYLGSRRYIEQWILWNVYTIIQFMMWLSTFSESYENISILTADVFYFILNITGLITWIHLKKKLEEKVDISLSK